MTGRDVLDDWCKFRVKYSTNTLERPNERSARGVKAANDLPEPGQIQKSEVVSGSEQLYV